jgi:hypothetical protein
MQTDLHERFDLSDVEVTSLPRVRQYVPRADSLDGELDALVAELQTEYRRAS